MAASNYAHYGGCGYKSFTITRLCLGRKKSSFPLLVISGDDSDYSLSTRRPSYTEMEKKTGVWKGELTE